MCLCACCNDAVATAAAPSERVNARNSHMLHARLRNVDRGFGGGVRLPILPLCVVWCDKLTSHRNNTNMQQTHTPPIPQTHRACTELCSVEAVCGWDDGGQNRSGAHHVESVYKKQLDCEMIRVHTGVWCVCVCLPSDRMK